VSVDSDELVVTVHGAQLVQANLAANQLVAQCALGLDIGVGQLTASCQMSPVPGSAVQALAGS